MDSNTDTNKKPRAWILELPTELLQHVASNCSGETLLQLRLTCKTLEAAVLDQVAKEFSMRLECFMLDPARLHRVQRILSSPRLATRVRSVALVLSAWDSMRTPDLVANQDIGFVAMQSKCFENYEIEQFDQHACEVEGLTKECEALVDLVIHKTTELKNCAIVVDVQSFDVTHSRISKCRPQLAKDLIERVLHMGGTVDGRCLSDQFALKASRFEAGVDLETFVANLRHFSYHMIPEGDACLQTAWAQQHWRIIAAVLESASLLQHLGLFASSQDSEVMSGEVYYKLCETASVRANLSALCNLEIYHVDMPAATLAKMLKSCANTLATVKLRDIGIVGEGDAWGHVLRLLHAMPRLQTMSLGLIFRRAKDVDDFNAEGWLEVHYWPPGEENRRLSEQMTPNVSVDAHPLLDRMMGATSITIE